MTYGSVMYDFCYSRHNIKNFIRNRRIKLNRKVWDLFKQLNNVISGDSEHTPSASFYQTGTAKREKRKMKKKLGLDKLDTNEMDAAEGKKGGFNEWILGVKKGDKHAERRENLA